MQNTVRRCITNPNPNLNPNQTKRNNTGIMCGDTDTYMNNGNDLYSESRQYRLAFQGDGNLVLYSGNRAIWHSSTYNNGGYFKLQSDGHALILRSNANGALTWRTGVYGYPKTFIIVQNDGNVVEYDSTNLKAVWNSGTSRNSDKANVDLEEARKQCYTASPTPAPIANPTLSPSATPTLKPSAQPSAGPTKWSQFFVNGDRPSEYSTKFSLKGANNDITTLARGGGLSCKTQKSALSGFRFMSGFDGNLDSDAQFKYNW